MGQGDPRLCNVDHMIRNRHTPGRFPHEQYEDKVDKIGPRK